MTDNNQRILDILNKSSSLAPAGSSPAPAASASQAPASPAGGNSGYNAALAGLQTSQSSSGGAASKAGGGMAAAGMMSANPYLLAGGLGLSAIGGAMDQKRQAEEDRRNRVMQAYGNFRGAVV